MPTRASLEFNAPSNRLPDAITIYPHDTQTVTRSKESTNAFYPVSIGLLLYPTLSPKRLLKLDPGGRKWDNERRFMIPSPMA